MLDRYPDGYARGERIGAQVASNQPDLTGDITDIVSLATLLWTMLRASGFAHLTPESDFIRGFASGFSVVRNRQAINKTMAC